MFFKKKQMDHSLYMIVGLGNPGDNYDKTRHNAGFLAVDALAARYGGTWKATKMQADTCRVAIAGHKVLLVKPTTFMNLSGQAVRKLQNFYNLPVENIFVLYDDVDISLGQIRMREFGGAGSHNGMRSIVQMLQSKNFPRIRIGIGPQPPHIDIVDFVLGRFTSDEKVLLEESLEYACNAVVDALAENVQVAMTRYNSKR